MKRALYEYLLSGFISLAAVATGFAQSHDFLKDSIAFEKNVSAERAMPDLSVPESPAFTLLGVTPANVTRPGTPRAFAASLLDAIDKNGTLQNGIAIDTAPLLNGTTLADYRNCYLKRFLANLQLSVATTKGKEKDAATQTGLGLHLVLYNGDDPRLNNGVLNATRAIYDSLYTAWKIDPQTPPERLALFETAVGKALTNSAIFARFKQRVEALGDPGKSKFRERDHVWTAAAALSNRSETSTIQTLRYNGWGAWSSYSIGLGKSSPNQLILHARVRFDERTAALKDSVAVVDYYHLLGVRFRTNISKVKVSAEGAVTNSKTTIEVQHSKDIMSRQVNYAAGGIFSVVMEARLNPNLWLNLSLYSEAFKENKVNTFGFKTALKWAAQL